MKRVSAVARGARGDGGIATNAKDLEESFQMLAAEIERFSSNIADIIVPGGTRRSRLATQNLEIAQTVFGKWCIEIFVILYSLGPIGFERLRQKLGAISPRVLSRKLKMMQDEGLVQRSLVNSRPPRVRYSLTETGATVARIGTPVFLLLSLRRESVKNVSEEEQLGHDLVPRIRGATGP